ncbi:mitochondrial import inner membrane translocase-like protein subunit tim16 [Geopyxis carbonaria]|nr:mitochondrial import inner membrane translocase-like protein subunit tim16 [Geopyxis carbonaria]
MPRVLSRLLKRASATAERMAEIRASGQDPTIARAHAGLTMSEACQILNVRPSMGGKIDMALVMGRFKRLFDANEPENGGSFYLQSKVLRARERIEAEVRMKEDREQREAMIERGWKPKLYR